MDSGLVPRTPRNDDVERRVANSESVGWVSRLRPPSLVDPSESVGQLTRPTIFPNFSLDNSVNRNYILASPRHHEGTLARSSRNVGAGCDGRLLRWVLRHWTKTPQRTAKSCGPGAATLALRRREFSAGNGGKKGASPGRARISLKTIARGKPGCPGCTCINRVHSFAVFAHGATGAVGARLSLRPLSERGTRDGATRAKSRRGNVFGCLKTESANSAVVPDKRA
jgi:hypothetical protein